MSDQAGLRRMRLLLLARRLSERAPAGRERAFRARRCEPLAGAFGREPVRAGPDEALRAGPDEAPRVDLEGLSWRGRSACRLSGRGLTWMAGGSDIVSRRVPVSCSIARR